MFIAQGGRVQQKGSQSATCQNKQCVPVVNPSCCRVKGKQGEADSGVRFQSCSVLPMLSQEQAPSGAGEWCIQARVLHQCSCLGRVSEWVGRVLVVFPHSRVTLVECERTRRACLENKTSELHVKRAVVDDDQAAGRACNIK